MYILINFSLRIRFKSIVFFCFIQNTFKQISLKKKLYSWSSDVLIIHCNVQLSIAVAARVNFFFLKLYKFYNLFY